MSEKRHTNFRFSDQDKTHIFGTPGKILFLVSVFLILVICVLFITQIKQPVNQNLSSNNSNPAIDDTNNSVTLSDYESPTREIISQYLVDRETAEFSQSKFCEEKTNQALTRILNLRVPAEHKDFHLQTVVLLDKENKNCLTSDPEVEQNLNQSWQNLLENFNWLNQ